MFTKWLAASGLAFVAALAPQAAKPAANDDITIECPEGGLELAELVVTARGVTGEPFFVEDRELKDTRIQFEGKVVVPKAKFLAFFEFCARTVDFVTLETMEAGTRVHLLRRLGGQGGGGRANTALKTLARIVEPAELKQMDDRWLLVTTTWTSKNLPARELVTTMQLYFADSATEAVRNVEGTDTIIMTGFAANLAALVKMCERLDAEVTASTTFQSQRALEARIAALEAKIAALAPKGK